MGQNKQNLSAVKRGMNRNTAPYQLEGLEYLFAYNTNIQDEDTTAINVTNEESNVLAAKFDEGFRVIGRENDLLSKSTYFFLANETTGESQFGVMKNNQVEQPDILDDLTSPLEEVEQETYLTFEVLINKGLNLNVNYPIKRTVIKHEQCGTVLAFTDDYNPPRLFVLEDLDKYMVSGKEVDPEKIAIFKKSLLPKINVRPIVTGGRLKRGTYEFLVAYTNSIGEEISEYTSITNPIPIFDPNNVLMESSEISDRTNFAIKLDIENLDTTKEYYKVVVIQNTSIDGAVRFFEEGIHPTSDTSIIYDTDENKKATSLDKITTTFPYVKRFKGLTETSGSLVGFGITSEKEINLQPVVNVMGAALKWQTSIGREGLYMSGDDVSKSKGYMRDETYPYSIRFKFDSGYTTALFPFINRPADYTNLFGEQLLETENVPDSLDVKSINSQNPAFAEDTRKKVWQFYNTAVKEGQRKVDIDYTTIKEPITKNSYITNIGSIPQPSKYITISFEGNEFTTFEAFIEDNYELWSDESHPNHFLYEAFLPSNYTEHKIPKFEDCDTPVRLEEEDVILVNEVIGEEINLIQREISKYIRVALDTSSTIFEPNSSGQGQRRDENFNTESSKVLYDVTGEYFFEKLQPSTNNSRDYAISLLNIDSTSASGNKTNIGYYNDAEARLTYDEIVTDYKSTAKDLNLGVVGDEGETAILNFTDRVSINALWFSDEFEEGETEKVIEVTKYVPNTKFTEIYANAEHLRVTIFNNCQDTSSSECIEIEPIISYFIDPKEGDIRMLVKEELENKGLYGNKILIAVDVPIGAMQGNIFDKGNTGWVAPTFNGKYAIHSRSIEYSAVRVTFDEITLDKRETYRATCNFKLPNVDEYEVVPYEYGKFSYIESSETYPNNDELYNSKNLRIDLDKIPESFREDFKKYYIKTNPDGTYELNDEADFRNKPIRHFKFPDNDISPFMSDTKQAAFSDSLIFPIGVHIDDEVVSAFLDIAVDNGLLTQEQRDSVIAYEIFRGDRRLEKSIEAKGLIYDNYQVKEENENVYFPNFPFNSLGTNELLYTDEERTSFIEHPYDSTGNNSFMFHSPDNTFRKLSTPTEVYLEGYQFGNSKSYFADVEGHPKWTILGDKAFKLATTLAIAETTAEIAIQIAEATIETSKNMWFQAGFPFVGGNPVGIVVGGVATGIIAGFQILSNVIFKVARYRQEWITTFKNLGQPENFASYSTGIGHYNSLVSIPLKGNKVRGINTLKNLKSSRYSFRHNDTGERIILNNTNREDATYLYLGKDYPFTYPASYREHDNYDANFNYSSRTIATNEGACKKTNQSREILSNIASPYISLKNYIPSQYGTIDSIKWLPTSYISYFDGNQDTIFGGDIFISRMALKRKTPLFLRDSMKLASLTPFNYGFYSNIGDARFYCNYDLPEEVNLENSLFPQITSEHNFDCLTGDRDFYVKPPSKFYLYYYGIPSFLVESEINVEFRYGKKELRDNFYPNIGDIVEWTQEENVSITEPNTFYYNPVYSNSVTPVNYRTLPFTYSREEYDCKYDSPNGAMWSNPDRSEKDISEPWLIFKPLNFHNFPASFGDLIDLKGIESERVLGRFTKQTAILNAVDAQIAGIEDNRGDGALFARRPTTFTETDLGYLGTKHTDMISCEYGHFFVDTERGQVFRVDAAGQGMEEISKYGNKKLNGMDKWFKKHLPFKIFKPIVNNYEDIDIDNPYNDLGIAMGWDSKYKRIFLTKKDYIPLKEMNYENGNFFAAKDEFELITDYEADGYTYLGKEGYYYKFNKQVVNLPEGTTMFVVVNTNDYTITEANEIKAEVLEWKEDVDFNGTVVFIPVTTNRWLKTTSDIIEDEVDFINNTTQWRLFSTYSGQDIGNKGVIVNFINSSAYEGSEPTNDFLNDYTNFIDNFNTVDYLRNVLIVKNTSLSTHLDKILKNTDEYKDFAIQGTNPQRFLERLNTYGYSYIDGFTLDTQQALNESLGDEFDAGTILIKGDTIKVTDTEFFKDVSWTIAYHVETQSWLSYYSFKPNYYVSHNTYFQTGLPDTLWSHNMSNKSYGVFYGEKEPWIVEYPIKNEFMTKRLQSVSFTTEARKYLNEYDYAYDRNETFDSAIVYNGSENSGKLNLIPQKTLSQITKYPITRSDSQDILITNQDYDWTFNNIYNRALNQDGTDVMWISDDNQIHKDINKDLVQFGGKKILSYLRGNYFIVRLEHNKSSQHHIFLKWALNREEIY